MTCRSPSSTTSDSRTVSTMLSANARSFCAAASAFFSRSMSVNVTTSPSIVLSLVRYGRMRMVCHAPSVVSSSRSRKMSVRSTSFASSTRRS